MSNAANFCRCLMLTTVAYCTGETAVAQTEADVHPHMHDKFAIQAGAFLPRLSFQVGVDGELTGEHPPLDFEGRFGVKDDDQIFSADIVWRFGDRWSLRGQYFASGRDATVVLNEDIEWGDDVLNQGSSLTASTETEITRLFFARDFSESLQHEFGFGLGVHRLAVGAGLGGNLIINGESLPNEVRAVSSTAPLPNIGGWYAYSPSEKWMFDFRLDWLDASIGEYSGGFFNVAIGANYQVFKHFGIGLKYQDFTLKLDVDKSDWRGDLKLSFEGIYFFLSANWH